MGRPAVDPEHAESGRVTMPRLDHVLEGAVLVDRRDDGEMSRLRVHNVS
jgi:hypothetical protein